MKAIEDFFNSDRQQLSSFVYRITNNIQDTEDILQDTMITALEKNDQFKGDSELKTWIFSIASNKAIDLLRKEKRWSENILDRARSSAMENPEILEGMAKITQSEHGQFEVREHIELCFRCMSKTLPIEQQLAIILKDIYGFKVKEIASILNKSTAQIRHFLENGRKTMIDIFDRRCALINQEGTCHQCSELNGKFNPKQSFQEKKLEVKFAADTKDQSKEELYQLRAELVKSIDPLQADGHKFQQNHTDFICKVAKQSIR